MVNANECEIHAVWSPWTEAVWQGCETGMAGALLLRKEHMARYRNKVTRQEEPDYVCTRYTADSDGQ